MLSRSPGYTSRVILGVAPGMVNLFSFRGLNVIPVDAVTIAWDAEEV